MFEMWWICTWDCSCWHFWYLREFWHWPQRGIKNPWKHIYIYISCWDWRRAIQAGNNYGRLHFDCSRQVGPANPKRFINDEGSIVQDWSFANMLRLTNTLLAEDTDKIYQHVIQSLQNQSKLFKVQDMYQEGSFWGSLLKARWCFAASFMTFFP